MKLLFKTHKDHYSIKLVDNKGDAYFEDTFTGMNEVRAYMKGYERRKEILQTILWYHEPTKLEIPVEGQTYDI